MIRHYLTLAVRNLLKYRTQNLISIVGLGVCMLCFALCLYCSRFILSIDRCFDNRERIASVIMMTDNGKPFSGTSAALLPRLRSQQWDEVEAFTYVSFPRERNFNVEVTPGELLPFDPLTCIETDSCFRGVFTPEIVAGSWEAASHTPNAVVMMRSMAEQIYGNAADAIGRQLVSTHRTVYAPASVPRDDGTVYTVQAVMEDLPGNNSLDFLGNCRLLLVNDSEGLIQWPSNSRTTGGSSFALLRPGLKPAALEAAFRRTGQEFTMNNETFPVCATTLGKDFWNYSAAPYFAYITLTLGVLILLAGLINFFQFLTGSFLARTREYCLRIVLGSGMRHLVAQLFTQCVLVVLIAFLITFTLIEWLAPYLHITLAQYTLTIDPGTLMAQCGEYLLYVFVLCLMVSVATVASARRTNLLEGIRGNRSGRGRHRLRNVSLGIQYFICWVFVTLAAALFLQSRVTASSIFDTLTRSEKADILSIPLDYTFMQNADKKALIARFKEHAGVADCILSDIAYTGGASGGGLWTAPPKDGERTDFNCDIIRVEPGFFRFMNMPVTEGRLPRNGEMMADETLQRAVMEKTGKSLVGTMLYDYRGGHEVTGVCRAFTTHIYRATQGTWWYNGYIFTISGFDDYIGHCYLKCHAGQRDEVREHVLRVLSDVLPHTITPRVTTMMDDLEERGSTETKLRGLILFFALVCVAVTLLGVYAAITLDTDRRRKEVAIRKVNGAGLRQILLLFARTYLWMLGVTALLAFPPLAFVFHLWSSNYSVFFSYGVPFWAGILLTVAAVTAPTVIFRILRVARVNPAETIKSE